MKRSQQIIVRLTPTEKAALKQSAREADMSISDYCRFHLFISRDELGDQVLKLRALADRAIAQAQAADRRVMLALAKSKD